MTLKLTGAQEVEDGKGGTIIQPTYEWDDSNGAEGVLFTGPVEGIVTLKDGTIYNVSPPIIEHKPGHAGELCHHIAKSHEAAGTLEALTGSPVHTCTPECGTDSES